MAYDDSIMNLQLQHQGYLKTPLLWKGDLYDGLTAFDCTDIRETRFEGLIPEGLRLGKRIEYFALSNLSQQSQIQVIANNIQILRDKTTLGELDALLMVNNQPIHLEIVYKFYLFDEQTGAGLNAWIGPNRRDSLIEKLNRLKNHQLPLLYLPETVSFLNSLHLDVNHIKQRVLFKAQLFLPEHVKLTNFDGLNKDCIAGVYLHFEDIARFKSFKWFLPSKMHWIVQPHTNVNWMSYTEARLKISTLINKQYAPMVWLKHPKGTIKTCFIIWW